MDTTIEKRMRKRMTMISSEKNRSFNKSQFGGISLSKSFDEIKDEREVALGRDHRDSPDDERDDTCDSSVMADCISELRRRRIHEMTYRRPYPTKAAKKKHTFWQIEDQLPRPAVLLSPSFSETDNASAISKIEPPSNNNEQALTNSSNKATARVLWKDEIPSLENNVETVAMDNSVEVTERFGYEEDEIMTPVRFKKFIDVSMDSEGPGQIHLARSTVNEETVTEISEATQALSAFVTSAVAVMKEAKTPEKSDSIEYQKNRQKFESAVSASEPFREATMHEQVCQGTVSALKLFKDTAMAMAATPANKLITKAPTPLTTNTVDSITEEAELMVKKLGLGDNTEDQVVEKVDDFALWPSLFVDADDYKSSPSQPIGLTNKAMLEALVQGGALQREVDGKNMLKLFVDMYRKDTFEKIVSAVKELKGLQGLVICRALNKNRETYRSSQEIASLFDSTRSIQQLDSLTLLNFDASSMTNVAMMIHEQPLLYRLQIQLIDGTLNGEILGVIATAPRLTHVSFDIQESCSFGTLMNSKTLESVCVNSRNLQLKNSHLRTLIYSLQTNFTLTTLDLGPAISVEQFKSLCVALRQNFRLESLRLNLELKTQEESNIVAFELADLFRENSFLLNVWNYSYRSCDITAASKHKILEALSRNKSMQEFKFFSEDIGDWKNYTGGNTSWLKKTLGTPETNVTEDFDASASFYSKTSTLGNESLVEDDSMPFFNVDCSALSPPFDCSNVALMRAKFQSWANKHATNSSDKRMAV